MMAKNVLGIIYSNGYDECLPELTSLRTMGSVPFGGRYRLIDFPLSNMVNCGITKVGVITKSNYNSLMDHIGHGVPWDLSRKRDGLFLLPPFYSSDSGEYSNAISSLTGIRGFLTASSQKYVLLSACNVVCNMDYRNLLRAHEEKDADITICYTKGRIPSLNSLCVFDIAGDGRISGIELSPKSEAELNYSLNIYMIKKSLLENLLNTAQSYNYSSFERDILQKNTAGLKIHGYKPDEFCRTIDSLQTYYDVSMELLEAENRAGLFVPGRTVYTKVRDDVPVIYGLDCCVKNSLIADGCVIEGSVENSILFRGARVGKGAAVRNSIVMQEAFIGDGTSIDCVIMDKNVTIKPGRNLSGDKTYPFYLEKGLVI